MPSLLDLATETRLEIIRHVVPKKVVVDFNSDESSRALQAALLLQRNPALPLLLTNSIIKSEVLLLPKPQQVAHFGPDSSWYHLLHWLEDTPICYRSRFTHLEISVHMRLATENSSMQQLLVNRANKPETAKIWEESATREAKRAFDHVECVYSRRWGEMIENSTKWEKGGYSCEEYRWVVSGAKPYRRSPLM